MKLMPPAAFGNALKSPPSRGRGLKRVKLAIFGLLSLVAPFTGAWIETRLKEAKSRVSEVAPFTGAWIETAAA